MSSGYVQLVRCAKTRDLQKHPKEFTLLSVIAVRARWAAGFGGDVQVGEALIGDYYEYGLTRQEYRTALKNLKKWQFITTKSTNKGTIAKLIDSEVYNINGGADQPPKQPPGNQQATSKQPSDNHPATNQQPLNKRVKGDNRLQGEQCIVDKGKLPDGKSVVENKKRKRILQDAEQFSRKLADAFALDKRNLDKRNHISFGNLKRKMLKHATDIDQSIFRVGTSLICKAQENEAIVKKRGYVMQSIMNKMDEQCQKVRQI